MQEIPMLPGLERLLDTCGRVDYPVDTRPPGHSIPGAGQLVAGYPLDPVLATVYKRFGKARFGGEYDGFLLHQLDDEWDGLTVGSAQRRQGEREPFHSSVIFGSTPAMAYYYATVPKLADGRGYQPVLYIDAYEEGFVVPVASDVDRFFDTFSRYVELVVRDAGYRSGGAPEETFFPLSVPQLIAWDRPLVERLAAGHFDFLMTRTPDTRKWTARVKKAAHV